ncbi:uncharacterized protein TNCV_866431 [Trichonephila clavipes]|nr:uncharacterized protein TNCV_866431 [Trichonephila clavipes]
MGKLGRQIAALSHPPSSVTELKRALQEAWNRLSPQLIHHLIATEWYRHRIVAGFVTSSSPVPLKTRRVGQRCTLNLSRAEMSSRWCGVVVRRGGSSSGVVYVT